jgi:L-asparaginase II
MADVLQARVCVSRGGGVESEHVVHAAVVRADAAAPTRMAPGCFARSAIKPLQAIVLVESGAADHFGMTPCELAVVCGSHAGDRIHTGTVAALLAKAGFTPADLDCGGHRPFSEAACDDLARSGSPLSSLHDNCSGKHAGFLLAARHLRLDPAGYQLAAHPLQRQIKAALEEICGLQLDGCNAIDGCGAPTYAIPLPSLALGFARFVTGAALTPARADAAARIRAAIAACPAAYGGLGRLDTRMVEACGEDVLLKSGAEGVVCAGVAAAGIGIAVKAADGAARAAEPVIAHLLARHMPAPAVAARELVAELARPVLRNRHGQPVGFIEVSFPSDEC